MSDSTPDQHNGPRAYTIGYGKPPKNWQWGPGQCGNPSGRPKRGATYGELIESILREVIPALKNGKTISMTKRDMLVRTIVDRGIAGAPAFEDVLIVFERPDLSRPSGRLIFGEADTEAEIAARLQELRQLSERRRCQRIQAASPADTNSRPSPLQQELAGNRRGRPRDNVPFAELIKRELNQRITVQENGETRTMTKREAWMRRLSHGVIEGNARALRILVKIYKPTEDMPEDIYFWLIGGR